MTSCLSFFLLSGISPSGVMTICSAVTLAILPLASATMTALGIAGDFAFHAGADERRFGDEERHALALHVRTHQRAVRIVVLKERDEAGGHGDELLRRDVHVVDLRRLDFEEVAAITHGYLVIQEFAFLVDRRIRLGDDDSFLPDRR